MSATSLSLSKASPAATRVQELFDEQNNHVLRRTDRMFAGLLAFQWLAGIFVALVISPRTWSGSLEQTHPHVLAAILLGGAIISLPVWLALRWPGRALTRHTIAVAQMLYSALLIHLTGGRIETHFHVFGSLTFLAFYRDWRVLITATVVVAVDHLLRGFLWPQSVYGVLSGAEWRWLEHAGWVLFLDFFLINACLQSRREMWAIAERQSDLEEAHQTVEKKVQERTSELAASEAFTRAILDSALDCIVTIDHRGKIIDFNPAAEATFGYRKSAAIGQNLSDLLIPMALRAQHDADMAAYLATGVWPMLGKRREVTALRADGEEFPVEIAVVPIHQNGQPKFTAFLRDIGEQRRAEETLRLQARVQESMTEGVTLTDEQGYILYANPAEEAMFGYGPGELLGKHVTVLNTYPEEQNARIVEGIIEQLRHRGFWCGEFSNQRKDGAAFTTFARITALDLSGRKVWVCVQEDITDRKRAEAELQAAKEAAESSSRAKSEFLANMSHEIRTPMNGIIGLTDLLLQTDLTADQRDSLDMVKTSADSLLTVINDILDFSKIEAGKLSLDAAEFRLRDSIGDALKALALRAHQKGLELIYYVAPDVPELVIADWGRLRQVLLNLVGNAIKFTDRGEVVVAVAVEGGDLSLTPIHRPKDVELHFTVSDTGIGIATDKLGMIFDPFTQADGSTTRKYGGTGLGLTICARLAALMGGRLWVESEIGKGSRFHFTARLAFPDASASKILPPKPVVLRGLPVLVVDDNATNRHILEQMLRSWEMRPTTATNGAEGLAELQRAAHAGQPYPLVLLDFMMPEMDGLTVAERIKAQPELASIAIMMLTSAHRREDVERCRELGLQAHLVKPIRPSDLQRAILSALGPADRNGQLAKTVKPAAASVNGAGKPQRRLRILLAEDNLVNQRVVVRVLEKQGHEVVVAGNGKEALERVASPAPFDLVLMDVQMPEMGGFEATAAIRARERETGGHLPIIALTAHAMKGDRERCLEAGMDDYLCKPIQHDELLEVIGRLATTQTEACAKAETNGAAHAVFDRARALQLVGGDEALLAEIVGVFHEDGPRLIDGIREAVAARDANRLCRSAHSLKGSLGCLSATPACEAALRLETLGRSGDLSDAPHALETLESELSRLTAALADSFR
jgi:PAS domain S-box-containing protein